MTLLFGRPLIWSFVDVKRNIGRSPSTGVLPWLVAILFLVSTPNIRASELQVIAGGSTRGPLSELIPAFEQTSGHNVQVRYGTTPQLIGIITSGGAFDVGIVPDDVTKDAAAAALLVPGPAPVIARVGLAVAVRAGAPKPDISTPEALKQTLLNAQSIATIPASATGVQLLQIFEELGISEEMHQKLKAQAGPLDIVRVVADGEVELAVFLIQVVMAPGLDVVGLFPDKVQREVVFIGAIAAKTKVHEAASDFIDYLMTPAAVALLRAKGMTTD